MFKVVVNAAVYVLSMALSLLLIAGWELLPVIQLFPR